MSTSNSCVEYLSVGGKALMCLFAALFVLYMSSHSSELNLTMERFPEPKDFKTEKQVTREMSASTSMKKIEECHVLPSKRNSCNKLPNFYLHKDRQEDFKDAIINFWHIQKTGGSSMEICLNTMYDKLNYPPPFICMASCLDFSPLLDDATNITDMTYRPIVHAHYSLGVCDFIREEITDRKCSVFTIFREPYERAVSHYFFHREYANEDPNLRDTLQLPVNEWVKKFGSVTWASFFGRYWKVTRRENGSVECEDDGDEVLSTMWPQSDYYMDEIINNLDKMLSFVGLFEDQDTTYRMLQQVYNLPFHDVCPNIHEKEGSYEGLNATLKRELKKEAKETLMKDKELQQLMDFDVRLYEKAKEIFYKQKEEFERTN